MAVSTPDTLYTESPYADAVTTAVNAARKAGRIIRERAGELGTVEKKGTNDFVTEVDRAAQDAITSTLSGAFPDHEIMAEEGDAPDDETAAVEGYRWIVDPLDGTTNFMHQIPPFAVSVALQAGEDLVVGVVLDVPHGELFTAVRGHGLHLNGEPAHVTHGVDALSEAMIATGFPYRRFAHTEAFLNVLEQFIRQSRGVRRHGSAAIDLARVACGRFAGFFETGLSPWDVAAGILLVEEGGGRVTDYHDAEGLPPVYEQQVIATNGAAPLHDEMLGILASMQDVRL